MRFAAVIAICMSFASGSYFAFNLSHPRRFELADLTRARDVSPRGAPSETTETQPLPTPIQQRLETAAESTPEPATPAPSAPISQTAEISSSPPDESPPIFHKGLTPVWAPLIAGILPGLTGNSVPEITSETRDYSNGESNFREGLTPVWAPLIAGVLPDLPDNSVPEITSETRDYSNEESDGQMPSNEGAPELSGSNKAMIAAEQSATAEPAASPSETTGEASSKVAQEVPSTSDSTREPPSVAMLQPNNLPDLESSPEISPTPAASAELSTEKSGAAQQAVTLPAKSDERKIVIATPVPSPSHAIQQQPSPVGDISLSQSRADTRKSRELALARSSARLYSSTTSTVLKPQPPEQKTETEASAPPPPAPPPEVTPKSVSRERGGKTDVTGELQRFAASYVREQEKGDVANQESYYAGSVHFYKEGDLSWTRISAATRRFNRTSGPKRYSIAPANVHGPVDGGFFIVEQPYTWSKSNGGHVQTGRSVLRMRVIPSGRGGYKITSIEEVGK
jgi:hypothetical protein